MFVGSPEWVESQVGAAAGAAATLGGAAAENSAAVGGAAAAACSLVAVGVEGEGLIGAVALADKVRPGAPQAVRRLRDMGLKVVILSGDRQPAVDAVARELGLGEGVVAAGGLLPADKEAYVKRLQADGAKVAMVGDGINDAPALVAADVGMAVSGGMEATAQAAGVVLLGSEAAAEEGGGVGQAADAVELGRNALGKIRQNLAWALAYNLVGIPVAAGGAPSRVRREPQPGGGGGDDGALVRRRRDQLAHVEGSRRGTEDRRAPGRDAVLRVSAHV